MKMIIKKTLSFVVVFLFIDLIFGNFAKILFESQRSGKFFRINYTIEHTNADILIMGSSHANRHFDPNVIQSKTGKNTYNAGVQGQKLVFQLALLRMISKRYQPETIVLNIDKNWLFESKEAYDRLSDIYPYYWSHRDVLSDIFQGSDRLIDLKLLFNSYRYNSTIAHITRYLVNPQSDIAGFRPLNRKMKPADLNKCIDNQQTSYELDENFIEYFRRFIELTQNEGIDLVLIFSPEFCESNSLDNESVKAMKQIALSEQIHLIDFRSPKFTMRHELFQDPTHLNKDGATIFTNIVSDSLIHYFGE